MSSALGKKFTSLIISMGWQPSLWKVCFSLASSMLAVWCTTFLLLLPTPFPARACALSQQRQTYTSAELSLQLITSFLNVLRNRLHFDCSINPDIETWKPVNHRITPSPIHPCSRGSRVAIGVRRFCFGLPLLILPKQTRHRLNHFTFGFCKSFGAPEIPSRMRTMLSICFSSFWERAFVALLHWLTRHFLE